MIEPFQKPFLQDISNTVFAQSGCQVHLLRLDVIHPGISGNKWYKLKYNLEEAVSSGFDTILTFGGAYSNHIHASSIAAAKAGLKSIGVIRGERVEPLNPTLHDAEKNGMVLHFISRSDYRRKNETKFIGEMKRTFGDFYVVPEGGTNSLAVKGTTEILLDITEEYDYIMTSVGTGGTMAGLICGLKGGKRVIGISVLKGDFLVSEVEKLVLAYSGKSYKNWEIIEDYHFGGYAKFNEDLISFINEFRSVTGIALDPIYTGKMMSGLKKMTRKGFFKPNTKVVALHTGGLQGIRGFNDRFGNLIQEE
ncbi:MAG: 1-aminocyclopropane-1-carboxylate deaminase/D-cysteine desulfhydrase [Saprospiraceae bacterium]|nr:1-aminocyclopropane-1-carboxylate deaminase/D-cysteine desulfhydrase [Saprospiraceae bacterium]